MPLSRAFGVCLVVGFLQDVVRKFVPGEPVFLTASVVVFIGAFCIGFRGRLARAVRGLSLQLPHSVLAVVVGFLSYLVAQSIRMYLASKSVVLPLIGSIGYVYPLIAIALGVLLGQETVRARRALKVYAVVGCTVVLAAYLPVFGIGGRAFQQVGESAGQGLVVYSLKFGALNPQPGLMRAPEVQAWHATAVACLLIVLVASAGVKSTGIRSALMAFLLLLLVGTILLTARRKSLIVLGLFVVTFLVLSAIGIRGRRGRRALGSGAAMLAAIATVVLVGAGVYGIRPDRSSSLRGFIDRVSSTSGFDRVYDLGIEVENASNEGGLLGFGPGIASQGSQHFSRAGINIGIAGTESGPGRVITELGLVGLALGGGLVFVILRHAFRATQELGRRGSAEAPMAVGLLSFVVVNLVTFTVYQQVFGDPFVITMLGVIVGLMLSAPQRGGVTFRDGRIVRNALQPEAVPGPGVS